jgi:integrative and conjugative element protein (TIGR02256 family)
MSTPNRLWIAKLVLAQMRKLASEYAPLETGGMLLGYESERHDPVITALVGAGPAARHRRLRFRPDYNYQQSRLEAHFTLTQGRETYLGDWHTHPSGACALSWLDKRVLARIARTPASGTTRPIMAVLADGAPEWRLHVSKLVGLPKGLLGKAILETLSHEIYDDQGRSRLS